MKTKLLFFVLLCFNLCLGQAPINQSTGAVVTSISNPIGPFGSEIFRFRSGLVTQLDSGSAFNFTNSQWFALGRLTAGTQTFYGMRFQQPDKSILMGYSSASPNNPRIEWIGNGLNTGNLEFRVGTGFGTPGFPGLNRLVATMSPNGSTTFGDNGPTIPAKVSIISNDGTDAAGLRIFSTISGISAGLDIFHESEGNDAKGIKLRTIGEGFTSSIGIESVCSGGDESIAIKGIAAGGDGEDFGVGIFAKGPNFAGYFDGNVFVGGSFFNPSDQKLKENVKAEISILEKIAKLKPVTYNYKNIADINLPKGIQHGFVAQDIAEVFPELTQDVKQPVFDKEGNRKSQLEIKSVNYTGLIGILAAGLQELNNELTSLKNEIASIKESATNSTIVNSNKVFMEQNVPNPFADQTTIRYQLPEYTNTAEIAVFDMTGKPVKSYVVSSSQKEITIKSSDIGRGLFIYCLVVGGQELINKRMIIN